MAQDEQARAEARIIEVSDARIEEALSLFRTLVRHVVKRFPATERAYRNTVCAGRPYPMVHEWLMSSGSFEVCAWCGAFVKSEAEEEEEREADAVRPDDDDE